MSADLVSRRAGLGESHGLHGGLHPTWSGLTLQAFYQVPLIIGLAGKNNTISYLTGISYQKFNYLHRAAGRLCLLTASIHAIGWIIKGVG